MSIDKRSSSLSPFHYILLHFFSAFSCCLFFSFFLSYPATFCCLDEIEIGAISIPHTRAIIKSYFRNCSPTFSRTKGKKEDDRQEKKSALLWLLLLVSFALISCYSYYIYLTSSTLPPADNKKRIKQERERARDKDLDKY